jgi:hypothetical protein
MDSIRGEVLTMMRDNVPVGKFATLHFMLSFAAQDEWKNDHLDVIPAFLNPESTRKSIWSSRVESNSYGRQGGPDTAVQAVEPQPDEEFLGIEIDRLQDGIITLGQQAYIEAAIRCFGMEDANTANTPLHLKTRLDATPEGETEADLKRYRSIVGCLEYAVQSRRQPAAEHPT